MNILEIIGLQYFSFRSFGEGDTTISHDIIVLYNKKDEVKKYFNEDYPYTFIDMNSLIDYFTLKTFAEYPIIAQEVIDIERDTKRKQYLINGNEIISYIKTIEQKFKKQDLIKYLVNNKDILFINKIDSNNIYLIEKIIEIICNLGKGGIELLKELIKSDYRNFIFRHFDNVKNTLLQSDELLKLFLSSYCAINKGSVCLVNKQYLSVIVVFVSDKKFNKSIINNIINEVVQFIKDICNGNKLDDKFLLNKGQLNEARNFLEKIKYPNISELQRKIKIYNKNEEAFFEKYGHSIGYNIDLKPHIQFLDDSIYNLEDKIHLLTHTGKKHFLVDFYGRKSDSLTEILCTNSVPCTKIFTIDFQQYLHFCNYIKLHVLQIFFDKNKDKLKEVFATLIKKLNYIKRAYKLYNYENNEIKNDINLLFNYFTDIFMDIKKDCKHLYYGICSLMFGLIEKILNKYIKSQQTDLYLSKNLMMGQIFDGNDQITTFYKNKLGEPLFYYLKYILYYEIDIKKNLEVGHNLRNKFQHYDDDCYDSLNYGSVLRIFLCYISICNELIARKLTNPKKEETV